MEIRCKYIKIRYYTYIQNNMKNRLECAYNTPSLSSLIRESV